MTVKARSAAPSAPSSRPRRRRGPTPGAGADARPAAVTDLTDLRAHDAARVGGKAAVLGTLAEAGFPVPPGFVVATDVFREALAPFADRLREGLDGRDLRDPASAAEAATAVGLALAGLAVPAAAAQQVREALGKLGDGPLAVRSSSTAEDREDASFAGQYETVVGVRGEAAVLAAILVCWRSYFAAGALAERAARGAGPDDAMAVLVQRVVDAECAGVAFSVDPVQGRRDLVVVEAAWGLGIGAVDGSVAADAYWVRREGRELDRKRIVDKPERVALDPEGGVRREDVAPDRRGAACLPDAWLARVAGAALMAEALLGRPQDIEWAIADGRLWVLQSRPIAALAPELRARSAFPVEWPDDEQRRGAWFLGSSSLRPPLEQDCMEDLFAAALADARVLTGHERGTRLRRQLGRLYSSSPPSSLPAGDRRVRRAAQQDLQRRLEREGRTFWDHFGPEVILATGRLRDFDRAAADGPGLADHLEDAIGAFRRHWTVHWQLWAEGMFDPFENAFRKLTGREEPEAGQDAAMLLEGEDTSFTRLMDDVHALAVAARETPGAPEILRAAGPDAAERLRGLPDPRVADTLDAFLTAFGGRIGSGFNSRVNLRTPCWSEDPAVPLALAAAYLDPGLPSPSATPRSSACARPARTRPPSRSSGGGWRSPGASRPCSRTTTTSSTSCR